MLLPFTDGLIQIGKGDPECLDLADRHYSRQKIGSNQFMPPGKTLVLRNYEGTFVFGWLWQSERDDKQEGYNCSIFRNESKRLSSEIILEAEQKAFDYWGPNRLFTYINPEKLSTKKRRGWEFCPWPVGRCFLLAGWKLRVYKNGRPHLSPNKLWLFVKPFHCVNAVSV
jgi:hypothetical protein